MEEVREFNGVATGASPIRDYEYSVISGAIENNFPTTYRVNYIGAEIKNQGNWPTCVGNAMATVLEAILQKKLGKDILISENFNYGALRKNAKVLEGMVHAEALQMQCEIGSVPQDKYNVYLPMPELFYEINELTELFEIAKEYKFANFVKLNNGDTRTGRQKDLEIKDALTKNDYPLFCIAPTYFGGGHAICIIGWDDTKNGYIIKNSWGENYGPNGDGTACIPKDEIREVYLCTWEPIELPFTDVTKDDWFYDDVRTAYLAGIIKGRTDALFDPNATITRAEAAAMMARLMKKVDSTIETFNDIIRMEQKYKKYNE